MECAFALGSQELYEFMDHNPMIATYSVDYTNNPNVIAQISNMISINGCLEVDFTGRSLRMQGPRQITGTGGQWDFVLGAYHSQEARSFLCMPSTYKDKSASCNPRSGPF